MRSLNKFIFVFSAVFFLFYSCDDILEENPKAIATENYYNTAEEIAAATNAIYDPIKQTSHYPHIVDYYAICESNSDICYGRGGVSAMSEYDGISETYRAKVGTVWTNIYLSIRNANLVIQNAPISSGASDEEKAQFVGEAKFLRALCYFWLVRPWKGVPIRTEENMDVLDVPRSSESDVWDFIVSDLEYAETNLPDEPRLSGTPSKWAAKTLLTEVYLWLEDWSNARTKAKEVVDSGKYSLVQVSVADDFQNLYGPDVDGTSEEIFYLKYNEVQGWRYMNYFYYPSANSSRKYKNYGSNWYVFYADTDFPFIVNWDDNDLRKQFDIHIQDIGLGNILFNKYSDPEGIGSSSFGPNDDPVYRYADLLLYYAEAISRVNGGPTDEAMECVNKVHRRAYGYNSEVVSEVDFKLEDYADAESFLSLILKERGYENVMENKRWFDLVRTGKAAEYVYANKGKTISDKHYYWPIPEVESNYNNAIDPVADQNPGY